VFCVTRQNNASDLLDKENVNRALNKVCQYNAKLNVNLFFCTNVCHQ